MSLEELRSLIDSSESIVAFTGAGISTESGIPDYRGPEGLWTKSGEEGRATSDLLEKLPALLDVAEPNLGHLALARLWNQGKLLSIVTQNVDRLHQAAGVPGFLVHELHGSGDNIVNFGDMLPASTWRKAERSILDCDLLLVLGSSLRVYPAASLVGLAQDDGKPNVIINNQPTHYDSGANLVINQPIGITLSKVIP